ncbi:melanopsin-B-like [Montipora foliosa]|uniref:melanopsin-B-like n=1 Tax=Montipora foliosa TaxID=591990 RepID=UPI0035F104A5
MMNTFGKWSTIFVVTEIPVCLLGIFFNSIVVLTIFKNRYRLSAPSYLILSIAVSDFLSCSVAVPISISRHFQKKWPFGRAGCQVHAFMIFSLALVSLSHLAEISAGKYLTITRSLSKQSYLSSKGVFIVIATSWVFSFILSAIPLVVWSRIYGLEGIGEMCSDDQEIPLPDDKAYFGIVFFSSYLLVLLVIMFSYFKIHQISKHIVYNTWQMRFNRSSVVTTSQALLKRHRKSAMYFLTVIAAFMLSWSPYAVVSFLVVLNVKLNPIATSACSVFAKTSFFFNPILYAIVSRKFRRRMVVVVPIARRHRRARPAFITSGGPLVL